MKGRGRGKAGIRRREGGVRWTYELTFYTYECCAYVFVDLLSTFYDGPLVYIL